MIDFTKPVRMTDKTLGRVLCTDRPDLLNYSIVFLAADGEILTFNHNGVAEDGSEDQLENYDPEFADRDVVLTRNGKRVLILARDGVGDRPLVGQFLEGTKKHEVDSWSAVGGCEPMHEVTHIIARYWKVFALMQAWISL